MARQVRFEVFRGVWSSFPDLFRQAARFATGIGQEQMISISHSEDQNDGVVTVWYWA